MPEPIEETVIEIEVSTEDVLDAEVERDVSLEVFVGSEDEL